jgi:hypothetical protein
MGITITVYHIPTLTDKVKAKVTVTDMDMGKIKDNKLIPQLNLDLPSLLSLFQE